MAAKQARQPCSTTLLEYADNRGSTLRVDREAGVIRDVKIVGFTSVNGRRYTREALAAALPLYEGIKVNVNHPEPHQASRPRSYQDRIGKLQNVRLAEDGLRGDLQYNPKHPLAEQLAWDAEHSPESVGLSHNVLGVTKRREGQEFVEAIRRVNSVDLVADPATTKGLFEGREPQSPKPRGKRMSTELTLEAVTLEDLRSARPDLVQQLTEASQQAKQLEQLQQQNRQLIEQVNQLTSERQLLERRETIRTQLTEAGLDIANQTHCSQLFLESLEAETDDAKRLALINDRKQLLEAAGARSPATRTAASPTSTGPAPSTGGTAATARPLTEAVNGWRRR